MNQDILHTIILGISFLLLFGLAELLYHYLHIKAELTRKAVHFGTGILTLLFPVLLKNHWLVLFLCSSFAVILIISLKFNLLKSINAIDRKSVGSICYPISVYTCYFVYEHYNYSYHYFYVPILILAICDPIAALCGKRWPIGKYKVGNSHKTILGSTMFFTSSFLLTIIFYIYFYDTISLVGLLTTCFVISSIGTLAEAFSKNGYDNITIPISVLITTIVIGNL